MNQVFINYHHVSKFTVIIDDAEMHLATKIDLNCFNIPKETNLPIIKIYYN